MNKYPLCVDLDGTFLHCDLSIEAIVVLIKKNPAYFFIIPFILIIKGKAAFKKYIAQKVDLEILSLPKNKDVYNLLIKKSNDGQDLILITGSNIKFAKKVFYSYPIFSKYFGSDEHNNMTGANKAKFLCEKFGEKKFDYIGNSKDDLKVFSVSNRSYYVGSKKTIIKKISNLEKNIKIKTKSLYVWARFFRIYQWAKNLLIFTPIIFSHSYENLSNWYNGLIAFIAFCLIASSVYLFNDLIDLDNDRLNQYRKKRPMASGLINPLYALIFFPILLIASLLISLQHNILLFYTILIYFILNQLYSFKVKQLPIIDVFFLSSFYIIRILAGGYTTQIDVSFWFKAFSFFIFLSLGFLKRFIELQQQDQYKMLTGRGYRKDDISLIEIIGIGCGLISILVFTLYLFLADIGKFYNNLSNLWPVSIALLYWISIMWLKAKRGEIVDDPVKYALKDKTSYFIAIFIIISIYISI